MSDSLQLYGLYTARVLCPWGSPGKNTGVGCQALLQGICPTQSSNTHLMSLAMAGGFFTTRDTWEALWPQLPLLSSHPGIWNAFLNFRNIHFKNVCSVKLYPETYFHFPWGQVQIIDSGFTVCIRPLEYWLRGEGHKWDTTGESIFMSVVEKQPMCRCSNVQGQTGSAARGCHSSIEQPRKQIAH